MPGRRIGPGASGCGRRRRTSRRSSSGSSNCSCVARKTPPKHWRMSSRAPAFSASSFSRKALQTRRILCAGPILGHGRQLRGPCGDAAKRTIVETRLAASAGRRTRKCRWRKPRSGGAPRWGGPPRAQLRRRREARGTPCETSHGRRAIPRPRASRGAVVLDPKNNYVMKRIIGRNHARSLRRVQCEYPDFANVISRSVPPGCRPYGIHEADCESRRIRV